MREPLLRTMSRLAIGSSLLLAHLSCDMPVRTRESPTSQSNQTKLTRESDALFQAVRSDDLVAVKESLNHKADPNARDRYGFTPLMIASIRGSVEVVLALINAGADVNAENPSANATPLNMAILGRKPGVIKTLVASGVNVNAPDSQGRTALHDVVEKGDLELLKALLAAPASVYPSPPSSRTIIGSDNTTSSLVDASFLIASDRNQRETHRTETNCCSPSAVDWPTLRSGGGTRALNRVARQSCRCEHR